MTPTDLALIAGVGWMVAAFLLSLVLGPMLARHRMEEEPVSYVWRDPVTKRLSSRPWLSDLPYDAARAAVAHRAVLEAMPATYRESATLIKDLEQGDCPFCGKPIPHGWVARAGVAWDLSTPREFCRHIPPEKAIAP